VFLSTGTGIQEERWAIMKVFAVHCSRAYGRNTSRQFEGLLRREEVVEADRCCYFCSKCIYLWKGRMRQPTAGLHWMKMNIKKSV
jgi:hypothetical protein